MLGILACMAALASPALSAVMSNAKLSHGVKLLQPASSSQTITLSIGLALQNLDQLEAKLQAVSTPGSPDYGKYLDKDEVEALFAPSDESINAVKAWLKGAGVSSISHHKSSIKFATTVSKANKLLDTNFAYFSVHGVPKLRTLKYSVPDEVAQHIQMVHPTTYFGRVSSVHSHLDTSAEGHTAAATSNCSVLVTPDCFRSAYGVGDYVPDPSSGSRVAFGSFLNESAQLADSNLYQSTYGIPPQNFSIVLINGGVNVQGAGAIDGEADLDAQFENAVSYPLPITEFITGGSPPVIPNLVEPAGTNTNEPYLEYYQYLLNQTNADLPQVISNSYGDDEQTVPFDYATRVCDMIGMMGLRGITILESSGDSGVGAACMSNDGKNHAEFTPTFPGSCPYITAVGGTQSWAPEVAWVGSSGGFSNYFPQAWYQTAAVNEYLQSGINPAAKSYYEAGAFTNFSGRGYPDIAAHSVSPNPDVVCPMPMGCPPRKLMIDSYAVVVNGRSGRTGGTSAAAPVVAGIIGLLNDARLRAGKPTMGFINPWLYSLNAGVLTDVTGGSALGCTGTNIQNGQPVPGGGIIPWASWNATEGWDPATGLGLPNLQAMIRAALSV
ncbi:tripeptidyl-peptidase [Xylariales sp. PMI_506]|nr:tripeptidyl-peptidase [Xylariales sp. PMI_506]